jgi:hypothetical protein
MALVLGCCVVAKTDSRPCVVCRPSMAASYFLLLAQKKVTKENGTLGFAPLAERAVRYGWTGFAHRPSMACCRNRRDPSRARVRCTRLFRPPSAAAQRGPESQKEQAPHICDIAYMRRTASAAGTAALCSSRAPLGRGEQVEEKPACTARGRAQDARASDLGTGMCRERTPEPAREVCRHGCRQTATARVPFSLVTFFWASKRK